VIWGSDAKHFHAILYTISQSTGDTVDPPEDHIFESCTNLTIIPAADSFGNSHGILAQRICGRPGLIEDFLRDMVFSLVLVCTSASRLNIRPKEGEEKEDLEHYHCYHTVEYGWLFLLLHDPIIIRLASDNTSIGRLLRRHQLRWHGSLKS
jgi:hypothetical protein